MERRGSPRLRSRKGLFSVLIAIIAGFLLVPAMLFAFDIGRINLAHKELAAVADSAALAGAIAISHTASTDDAELTEIGRKAGLMFVQRNSMYNNSLSETVLSESVESDTPALNKGTFDLDYDPTKKLVTAKISFGTSPAFGALLGLGTTTVRAVSKATTARGSGSDIIVLFDYSDSMTAGKVLIPARDLTSKFIGKLSSPSAHVGLTYFALKPSVAIPLSKTSDNIANASATLAALTKDESGTNTGDALQSGMNQLNSAQHRPGTRKVILLITDGLARKPKDLKTGTAHALNVATQAGLQDISIFGIGFFHDKSNATIEQGKQFMQQLKDAAGGESDVFTVSNVGELQEALDKFELTAGGITLTN